MLAFIKIICKVIFYYKIGFFGIFKVVFVCKKDMYRELMCVCVCVCEVRYCGHIWVQIVNCLKYQKGRRATRA
jgi:hypothetical protein